ncbi:hypothetical protein APLC1_1492 [Limnospira platensis C1]|nr:hypothetical protein APLC1_1492 [Arthrospira platensis C1]
MCLMIEIKAVFRYLFITMVQAGHSVSLIMDGWQWSDFGVMVIPHAFRSPLQS